MLILRSVRDGIDAVVVVVWDNCAVAAVVDDCNLSRIYGRCARRQHRLLTLTRDQPSQGGEDLIQIELSSICNLGGATIASQAK